MHAYVNCGILKICYDRTSFLAATFIAVLLAPAPSLADEKGKRGEDNLTDINYQMKPSARLSSDRYAYEKALLDAWFRRVVGRDAAAIR